MTVTKLLIGEDLLIANLEKYSKKMTDEIADAQRKAGGELVRITTPKVPLETGEMRSRSFNEGPLRDGESYIQVVGFEKDGESYGTDNPKAKGVKYAVPLHERTYVHHDVGEAKFLEHGLNEFAGEYSKFMAEILKEVR